MTTTEKKLNPVTADMLTAKIAEAQKVLKAISGLSEMGLDIPEAIASQEKKARAGLEFLADNGMPQNADDIQTAWIKFQGQRGRTSKPLADQLHDFVGNRKEAILAKLDKLANEFSALEDFSADYSARAGSTCTFYLPKEDGEIADRDALALKMEEYSNQDYFAIFRKDSESSRRGELVGGFLYTNTEGSIDSMLSSLGF